MEAALGVKHRRGQIVGSRALARYADDFCVFCESQRRCRGSSGPALEAWLQSAWIGVFLGENPYRPPDRRDSISSGFHIRLYPVTTTKTGWKLLTTPEQEVHSKATGPDERRVAGHAWLAHSESHLETEPHYSRMGELLPHGNGEGNHSTHWMIGCTSKKYAMSNGHIHTNRRDWQQRKYWGQLES